MQKESSELMQYAKEAIERKLQEEAAAEENTPMPTKTLAVIFDDIKTEALDYFAEALQMA